MAFGIWVQGIDDRTGAANIEQYAEIQEYDELYADGFAKEFCDGQVSPTAPRFPDDKMGMLWVDDRETAEFIQGILREDIATRVATEGLKLAASPTWFTAGQVTTGLTATAMTGIADDILGFAPVGVSPAQVQTAIDTAVEAGMSTADEVIGYVKSNARWMK